MHDRYGISRIDQDDRQTHGWQVRLQRHGHRWSRWFADSKNGGKEGALRSAQAWRDGIMERERIDPREMRSDVPQSGVPGVTHVVTRHGHREYPYWQAVAIDESGSRRSRKFSCRRYGDDGARRAAIEAQRALEAELTS